MAMEPNEELLKKLMAMKEELNAKQRKLDKSKRAANVKAHIRQKIQEQNIGKCSSPIKFPDASSSEMLTVSHSDSSMLDCAPIHESDGGELWHANNYKITVLEATLSSADESLIHSALAVPCLTSDVKPTKSTSHNSLKVVNTFLQHRETNLEKRLHLKKCADKAAKREINQSSDKEENCDNENPKISLNLRSRAENVPPKRSRQESLYNDDFKQYNKTHTFSRSRRKSRMSNLQPTTCRTLCLDKYSQSLEKNCLSDTTVYKPLISNQENFVKLFEEKSSVAIDNISDKLEYGSGSIIQDLQSVNYDTAVSGIQSVNDDTAVSGIQSVNYDTAVSGIQSVNDDTSVSGIQSVNYDTTVCGIQSVNDDSAVSGTKLNKKCFGPIDLLNQILKKGTIRPNENSCDSMVINNKSVPIDCMKGNKLCLNKKTMIIDREHCETIQQLTVNCVPNSSKTGHFVDAEDFAATCYDSCMQPIPYVVSTINTTNDPDIKSNNYEVLPSLSKPHNIATVNEHVYQHVTDVPSHNIATVNKHVYQHVTDVPSHNIATVNKDVYQHVTDVPFHNIATVNKHVYQHVTDVPSHNIATVNKDVYQHVTDVPSHNIATVNKDVYQHVTDVPFHNIATVNKDVYQHVTDVPSHNIATVNKDVYQHVTDVPSHNIATVNKDVYQHYLDVTDFSKTNKDENTIQKNRKESSLSNESDEDIVKGSQNSMITVRPNPCGRRQMSLNADHSQNILSLTPSFGSLHGPLSNKSLVETNKNNEQEPVTDSEFFSILGLTQAEKEVLNQRETQTVNVLTPKSQKNNTSSSMSNLVNNDCAGKLHNSHVHNVIGMASASDTLRSTPLSGNVQIDLNSKQNSSIEKDKFSKFNNETLDKSESWQTADENVSSEDPFLEYTELDVIPYSQFELTEDFLSETRQSQEGISKSCHQAKYSGALVKRRSPRISSFCFTQSSSLSLDGSMRSSQFGSELENFAYSTLNVKPKQRRSLSQQKRTATIRSAFQFLMDQAKKTSSFLEFELPISFNIIKTSRTESTLRPPFFEAQCNVGNINESIEIEGERSTNINNILSSKYLSEKNVGEKLSSVSKKDQEHNVTIIQESIDGNQKNVQNIYADCVQGFMHHSDITDDLPDRRKETGLLGDQQVHNVIYNDVKIASHDTVQACLLEIIDNNSNLKYNRTDEKHSNYIETNHHRTDEKRSNYIETNHCYNSNICTTPLRLKNKHIYKSGRRFANPSIAKKLFVAKSASINAGFHNFNCKTRKGHFADVKALPVENASNAYKTSQRLLGEEESFVCSSLKSTVSSCPVGMSTLPEIKTSSPRPGSSVTCETPRTPNTLCIHSPSDSFSTPVATPEPILHPFKDSLSHLSTPINALKAAQTSSPSVEFASPELNSSFLHLPNAVTPASIKSNQLSSSQKTRGGFSFTSTPKFTTAYKTTYAISEQGMKSSIEAPIESDGSGQLNYHSLYQHTLSFPSKLSSPVLSIGSEGQMLSPDESYLSPAQIPVDGKDLLAARKSTIDGSLMSSPAERSNSSLNLMSCLSTTFSNIITPWKHLPKTASTPVLVLEKEDHRHQLGVPVFSPIIKRSRSKPASNSVNTSHLPLKFAGCFQCCARDAVVSLLSGMFKTSENEEKYYIVSVQATSLTVWTEDDLSGWTAELDWRLCPEIHVMKACLLPRTDTVIAVVASGWDKHNIFATLFVYDWSTEDTARFNIPNLELQNELKSPSQIELCPFLASELHIAVTSDTHHTVGRVTFTDSARAVQSSSLFGVHRGKLINFVALSGQESANVSLTGDQEVSIWNMKLGVVLKKVKLQSTLPCLTGLLAATSYKGILLLDTVWRVDDGDCGGVIAVNPLTGDAQKIVTFSVPNNTWRSIESAKVDRNIVTAISDKGSLGIWDKRSGALLGYTKSKITTCASLMMLAKHLVVGEMYGCLHIYSAPN